MKHPISSSLIGLATVGVVAYSAIGFFYVPSVIESTLSKAVSDNLYNSQFKVGKVGFNPFTFAVSLEDLVVKGKKEGLDITAAIKETAAKVNVLALLSKTAEIEYVRIASPTIVVKTNFSTKTADSPKKLAPSSTATTPSTNSDSAGFDWLVKTVSLTNGDFAVADTGIAKEPQIRMQAVDFSLSNLGSSTTNAPYALKANTMDGSVGVNGEINMKSVAATFKYDLKDLQLKHFSPWLYAKSQNNLTSGAFNLNGSGTFANGISTTANAEINKLKAERNGSTIGSLSNLSLLDVTFNSDKQPQLRIGELKTQFASEKKAEKAKKVIGLLGAVAKIAGKDKLASQIETVQQTEINNVSIKKIVYANGQLSVNDVSKDTVQRELQNQVIKSINKILTK